MRSEHDAPAQARSVSRPGPGGADDTIHATKAICRISDQTIPGDPIGKAAHKQATDQINTHVTGHIIRADPFGKAARAARAAARIYD